MRFGHISNRSRSSHQRVETCWRVPENGTLIGAMGVIAQGTVSVEVPREIKIS